jgi:serine protease inhibitor
MLLRPHALRPTLSLNALGPRVSNSPAMRYVGFSILAFLASTHLSRLRAADMSQYPDRLNTFGFSLVEKLATPGQQNLLVSPASIEIALGMIYAGATGGTAEALSRVLGLDISSREMALKDLANLRETLQNPGQGVTLKVANAAWIDHSVHLNQAFAGELAETFHTKLETVPFDDSTTISRINEWVSKTTAGKIDRFLENPPSPPMFLANAVYFHAPWSSPFPKESTKEQPFYPANGSSSKVQMMQQKGLFRYGKGPGYEVVALPYADNRFAMYCFLPDKGVDPVLDELKKSAWSDFSRTLRATEGTVALPKFKFEYAATLNRPLTDLGLGIAFDGKRAQFDRMIDGPERLFIGGVLHKTFVEVDEQGTTAAAATGIQMRATAVMRPTEEFNLVFNRPFVTAIADGTTGTVLFLGIVGKP